MISKEEFDKGKILVSAKKYKVKEEHLEKLLYAFQLLDDLAISNIDFIFKGGTSLLLVTERANRLSIDIDIMVDSDKKDEVMQRILGVKSETFNKIVLQDRPIKPGVDKAHFEFHYNSFLDKKPEEMFILLDVVFDKGIFSHLESREIKTTYIPIVHPIHTVITPSIDELLGDKLTAFAPKTIGISYYAIDAVTKRPKNVEIIKQLSDIALLSNEIVNFNEVSDIYRRAASSHIKKMIKNKPTIEDCIIDSLLACSAIISYGVFGCSKSEYELLVEGLNGFNEYIWDKKLTYEDLVKFAVQAYVLYSRILHNDKINCLPVQEYLCFYSRNNGAKRVALAVQDPKLIEAFRKCVKKNADYSEKLGIY